MGAERHAFAIVFFSKARFSKARTAAFRLCCAWALCAAARGFMLGAMAIAWSQPVFAQSSSNVPGQGSLDAEIDPFPYDPRLEIRTYLQNHLPSLWWANEPEYGLGVFTVTIHVPVNWRGNPTSALQQLCPQANSTIWQGIKRLELQPFYKNAMWPGVVCRP
ncbi:hypothetical protein [Roseixanthobacter glucoisosaccharinicivorans]|uniref:hypothetical protein n=1 Tax=Roseixanthobacter glucoisosaccharinicivorans TaxID=3119923 RepID=UPI003727F526